ncbi:MAG: amidohydrolase family protein, partial [Syntrophales bacterium]|nr:amidohydrolase family protein [Syntrophales bacterium]
MKQVDLIITDGTILTMDDKLRVFADGIIAVAGDRIVHVGSQEAAGNGEERFEAPKIIDARGCIVLPGLINGHTHAAMTLFRGLADDLALMDWLQNYIFPIERQMDGAFVYAGTTLACAEMIRSGTTTFCDMYLFEAEVARAAADAGMRALVGEVLYDFPSPNYGPLEEGFAYTQRLIDTWRGHPLVSIAVEPHTLFTCSAALLKKADVMARENGVPLIIHVAETLAELDIVKE